MIDDMSFALQNGYAKYLEYRLDKFSERQVICSEVILIRISMPISVKIAILMRLVYVRWKILLLNICSFIKIYDGIKASLILLAHSGSLYLSEEYSKSWWRWFAKRQAAKRYHYQKDCH